MARARTTRRSARNPRWASLSDDALLGLRICDLGLELERSPLQERVDQLNNELTEAGFVFLPHCWLSNEWFTPVGVPGIALPFYLAHPRLTKLEKSIMLEAEGESRSECMRILRHEAGHAYQNAYRLNRRKRWRELFGRSGDPYPETYQPKPYSRRFVMHIDQWYAQAHPDEDFAETFAVWMTPGHNWRRRYRTWPAIRKLEYVDELMREVRGQRPPVRNRRRPDSVATMRHTLREHYDERRARYGEEYPEFNVRDLRRLFSEKPEDKRGTLAATFLRRVRPQLLRLVSRWTGEFQYTIDRVYREMIESCEELRLRVPVGADEDALTREVAVLLTVQTMNHLHTGGHRLTL